ncbi:MAG: hypothetical protein JST16_11940 [Bdellovibrionales bacterium]|nr:hypothetical protein [Bdellovibrionales bacterium]
MKCPERLDEDTLHWRLRHLGRKARGLGFLIGLQQIDPLPLEPAEEAYEGIGLLVEDLGRELIEIAAKIDEDGIPLRRQRTSKARARKEEDQDDD